MITLAQLRLVGVPRKVAGYFQAAVQVMPGGNFYVPVWLVQDAMGVRYTADLPPVKFDVAVDVRRQFLVLQPLPYSVRSALAKTEFKAVEMRKIPFVRVRLVTIAEIFQVEPPVRFPVLVARADGAIIVQMRKGMVSASCIQ